MSVRRVMRVSEQGVLSPQRLSVSCPPAFQQCAMSVIIRTKIQLHFQVGEQGLLVRCGNCCDMSPWLLEQHPSLLPSARTNLPQPLRLVLLPCPFLRTPAPIEII